MGIDEAFTKHPLCFVISGGELVDERVRMPYKGILSYDGREYNVPEEFLDKKTTLSSLLDALLADVQPARYNKHEDDILNFLEYCEDTGAILTDEVADCVMDGTLYAFIPSIISVRRAHKKFRYAQTLEKTLKTLFGAEYDLFLRAEK